jgi:hypothetical protein
MYTKSENVHDTHCNFKNFKSPILSLVPPGSPYMQPHALHMLANLHQLYTSTSIHTVFHITWWESLDLLQCNLQNHLNLCCILKVTALCLWTEVKNARIKIWKVPPHCHA